MSYIEYWEGDPYLFWAYRICAFNKQKQAEDFANYCSWLSGLYVYNAVNTVHYNLNKKQSDPHESYVSEPINFEKIVKQKKIDNRRQILESQIKSQLSKFVNKVDKGEKVSDV